VWGPLLVGPASASIPLVFPKWRELLIRSEDNRGWPSDYYCVGGPLRLLGCCVFFCLPFVPFIMSPGAQLETYVGELFPFCWSSPSKLKIREILGAKRQTMVEK
jgi:hypothetical protein